MTIKILLVVLFVFAVVSLFVGAVFMIRGDQDNKDKRTMYSLAARVSFCALALAILLTAFFTGNVGIKQSPSELDKIAEQNKADRH